MAQVQPQGKSAAGVVLAVVVIAGIAAEVYRFPGMAFIWVGMGIAAFFSVPAVLTGAKGPSGYPTTANGREERDQAASRKWSELKWKLFIPNGDWLANPASEFKSFLPSQSQGAKHPLVAPLIEKFRPLVYLLDVFGVIRWLVIPSQLTTFLALGAALAVYTLPTDALHLDLVWVNAAATYIVIAQTAATIRRHANQFDPSPGVRLSDVGAKIGDGGFGVVVASLLAAVASGIGTVTGLYYFELDWLIIPVPVAGVGVALMVAASLLHTAGRETALLPWRNTMAARAAWKPRWEGLKQTPYLISHERVGPNQIHVDTFEAPGTLGSAGAIALHGKLMPFMGSGVGFAMLPVPDTDSQGQPIAGSKHALRFRVVVIPQDAEFDATAADTDSDELRIRLEAAAFTAMNEAQQWHPILMDVKAISDPALAEDGTAPTMAWAASWVLAEAPAMSSLGAGAGSIGNTLQCEAYADEVNGTATLYFGAVTADTTNLSDASLLDRLEELEVETRWGRRWYDLLKLGEKPPVLQYAYRQESKLSDKVVINAQPFVVKQGLDPTAFFSNHVKKGLSTTLAAAPFVTVTGYPANGLRPGDRHPQGFTVLWSSSPVPTSPSEIPPSAAKQAAKWAIAGTINDAFDAAKLNRPEVVSARALTHKEGFTHIWKITLRLYDGVTSEMVKRNAEKLRLSMGGCAWLRVTESVDGCDIYAGADPKNPSVKFAHPAKKNMEECIRLDWEQAFIDAKMVSPADGSAPKLQRTDTLPTNDKVSVLEFTLPRGTHRGMVKEVVAKLKGATANDFIEVRAGTTQETFTLLVCAENPMPFPAKFNWDAVSESKFIPFATGVEGEPIIYDWSEDPHLLVLGGSGSGKSISLQVLLTGAILRGADVYLADPSKLAADFRFAAPWMKAIVTEELEASAMMDAVYDEVKRRRTLNGQYAAASYKDLPDDVRPPHVFVFLDEFTSLMMADTLPKLTGSETEDELKDRAENERLIAAKRNIGSKAGRIAREARSAGVTLVLATQALKADTLSKIPGAGDLKDLSLDTQIPVPVSERFPTGWASNRDLEVGDTVFAIDGNAVPIVGFSKVFEQNNMYELTFDDGQKVRAGSEHLWLASSEKSRKEHGRLSSDPTPAWKARSDTARRIAEATPVGTLARPEQIAELLELSCATVTKWAASFGLNRFTVNHEGQATPYQRVGSAPRVFRVDEVIEALHNHRTITSLDGLKPFAQMQLSARQIYKLLHEREATRQQAGRLNNTLAGRGLVSSKSQDPDTGFLLYDLSEFCARFASEAYVVGHEIAPLESVVTTREIADSVISGRGRKNWAIRLGDPVDLPDVDLPVDPYVLGAWVGDGSTNSGIFTAGIADSCTDADGVSDQEYLIRHLSAAGYQARQLKCRDNLVGTRGLRVKLREAGVLERKGIPAAYLRASREQRLALLQGLMDTDGTCHKKTGASRFDQVNKDIAMSVLELVRSLGIKAHFYSRPIRVKDASTGIQSLAGNTNYSVIFRTDLPVFRLPRKLANQALLPRESTRGVRYVVSAERVPPEQTRCISVDHPDHLFMVEGFVPTHNSNMSSIILGKTSFGQLQSALKEPTEAPDLGENIPRGRGLFESSASRAQAIQSWFDGSTSAEHLESMVERIRNARPELADSEKLDFAAYMPKDSASPVFGEVIGGRADEPAEEVDEVIDLGEVALDLDLGFDDLDEPEPVTTGADEFVPEVQEVAPAAPVVTVEPVVPVVASGQVVLLDVDGTLSPVNASDDWDDYRYTAGGITGEYLRSETMLGELAEVLGRDDTTALWLTDWASAAPSAFSDHLVADVIPRDSDELGWWKLDAFAALLQANPGIHAAVWVDDQLHREDELGVVHTDMAADIASRRGVRLTTVVPEDGMTVQHIRAVEDALTVADQPVTAPVESPGPVVMAGLFDEPEVVVPVQPNLFE